MESINWCCVSFKDNYSGWGERGSSIVGVRDHHGISFFFVFRATDHEHEAKLGAEVREYPVLLKQSLGFTICPWCGANLVEHYGSQRQLPTQGSPLE